MVFLAFFIPSGFLVPATVGSFAFALSIRSLTESWAAFVCLFIVSSVYLTSNFYFGSSFMSRYVVWFSNSDSSRFKYVSCALAVTPSAFSPD